MKKTHYYGQVGQRNKRPSKKRQYKEHNHQVAVFQLAKGEEIQYPELKLLTGSLAGVNLTPQQAGRAKAGGHKPGFPDIHLPTSHGQWFSLYIELKTDEGGASPKQLEVATMLRAEGNLVLFIKGSQAAWDAIMKYISMAKMKITKAVSPYKPDITQAENPIKLDITQGKGTQDP